MDREQFENDVYENLNDGLHTESSGDSLEGVGGMFIAIGETAMGALYGFEENTYGQRGIYRFDTEDEQRAWFDGVTGA